MASSSPLKLTNAVSVPTWRSDSDNHIRHQLSSSGIVIKLLVSNKYIVLSLDDATVQVFTLKGEPITIFRDQPNSVTSLAVQDDILLTGEVGGGIKSWDLAKQIFLKPLNGHTTTVRCLEFAAPLTAVSACKCGYLKIWDLSTGACQGTMSGHADAVKSLAIIGDVAVSGSLDCTAKVWSLSERSCLLTMSGHTQAVWSIATDGQRVFTGSLDHDVRVWELGSGRLLTVLEGHSSLVTHLVVHGDILITGGAEGTIIFWSLQDYQLLHIIVKAHKGSVSSLDARYGRVLSGGSDGSVKLWDLETAKPFTDFTRQTQVVWGVSLAPDGNKSAIVASAQGTSPFPKHDGAFLDVYPVPLSSDGLHV